MHLSVHWERENSSVTLPNRQERDGSNDLILAGPWLPESLLNESIFIWELSGLCWARRTGQQDPLWGKFTGQCVPRNTPTQEQKGASQVGRERGNYSVKLAHQSGTGQLRRP